MDSQKIPSPSNDGKYRRPYGVHLSRIRVLLVHLDQIAQIRPEIEAENEPRHEPVAVIILTNGEMLILKNSFKSVVKRLTEAKMVMRP